MFERPLKILLVSSEVAPFAKTGGLADVAGSLPKALATVPEGVPGHDVRVVMPLYRGVGQHPYLLDFPVSLPGRTATAIVRQGEISAHYQQRSSKIPVYLINNYHYFHRQGMYMFPDEAERFIFFCRAVLEMLPLLDWQPDLIHCNDWHTGPIPFLLQARYRQNAFYRPIATLFSIHNLKYQGIFPREVLRLLEVGEEYFQPDGIEFYGQINFMKMGLVYADIINTVSRTYAREIQTPELGEGLDGLLRQRSAHLYGIVNGINYHEFDPHQDRRIFKNYQPDNLAARKENKFGLQQEMGLPVQDVPVMGLVSRLVDQKGLDLLLEIVDDLLQQEVQLCILGMGDPYYEQAFREVRKRHPQKVGLHLGFNSVLAQRIYAGADIFLMPSRFEPCGLGQLIAMRYGAVPVVRSTGGLADTVADYNTILDTGTGFVFQEYSGRAFYQAIGRALQLYHGQPLAWQRLVRRCMEKDFSWARSGMEYLQLYYQALRMRQDIEKIA
ncbi:MAG: glycogen synthase GlgA [Desulfurispora sp.]|uniref:glycogen synthase GlgA n=1 Tax=Desulfurispora sp. TaxID=3014275 RepID=UPI00404A0190